MCFCGKIAQKCSLARARFSGEKNVRVCVVYKAGSGLNLGVCFDAVKIWIRLQLDG
jgi:hypothetical protein